MPQARVSQRCPTRCSAGAPSPRGRVRHLSAWFPAVSAPLQCASAAGTAAAAAGAPAGAHTRAHVGACTIRRAYHSLLLPLDHNAAILARFPGPQRPLQVFLGTLCRENPLFNAPCGRMGPLPPPHPQILVFPLWFCMGPYASPGCHFPPCPVFWHHIGTLRLFSAELGVLGQPLRVQMPQPPLLRVEFSCL